MQIIVQLPCFSIKLYSSFMYVCKVSFILKTRASPADGIGRRTLCVPPDVFCKAVVSCPSAVGSVGSQLTDAFFPGDRAGKTTCSWVSLHPMTSPCGVQSPVLGPLRGARVTWDVCSRIPRKIRGSLLRSSITVLPAFSSVSLISSNSCFLKIFHKSVCHSQTQSLFSNNHSETFLSESSHWEQTTKLHLAIKSSAG